MSEISLDALCTRPHSRIDTAQTIESPYDTPEGEGAMARVLIANDDADFLEICRNVLEDAGHTVGWVEGGIRAVEEARRLRPDVIVVDFQMPDMDGVAAIRALRAAPETASIPILMMSGAGAGRESAKQAGANAFLEKPFRAEELIDSVNSLIDLTAEPLNEVTYR